MSNYRVLISCPLIRDTIAEYDDRLEEHGIDYDVVDVDQHLSEERLLARIDEFDAILAGDDELTHRVFESADRLRVVVKWGVGTDNIDEAAAEAQGIAVYNTPDAFGDEVSDAVIGYAIMLTRKLHQIDRAVRNGEWACPRGVSLAEKTFGVIGVGDIGSAVARRASAHRMEVVGTDVRPFPADLQEDIDIECMNTNELLAESDLVSLNCALTDETRQMIGEHELGLIGEDGYLINTARGELIDQDALVEALESGTIAGAALDVFEEEPLPENSSLTDRDNVILGSHNVQNTQEVVSRVNDRAIKTLIDGLVDSHTTRADR